MAPSNSDLSVGKMPHKSTTLFDDIPDDVLGNILLFCPFPSAVHFARGTCKNLRHRSSQLCHVWELIYDRQGFFPPDERHDETDYLMLGTLKCQLLSNVTQTKSASLVRQPSLIIVPNNRQRRLPLVRRLAQRTWKNLRKRRRPWSAIWKALNPHPERFQLEERHDRSNDPLLSNEMKENQRANDLPDHYFHFRPILPSWIDPEYHKFSTLMIPTPVFDIAQCFALIGRGTSPELLLLSPFDGTLSVFKHCFCLANRFDTGTQSSSDDSTKSFNEDDSDSFHDSSYQQQKLEQPFCDLLAEVDLISTYFPQEYGRISDNFSMSYWGIDALPIWRKSDSKDYQLEGYLVGALRCFENLNDESFVCSEFTTWVRSIAKESMFGNPHVCRLPFTFDIAELDASHLRVFVLFGSDIEGSHNTISVYPLTERQEDSDGPNSNYLYFPKSLFSIHCQEIIATFSLDVTGETLLVATRDAAIEIWMVGKLGLETAHRQHVVHLLTQPSWILEAELTRRMFLARSNGMTELATFIHDRGEGFVEKPVFPAFHHGIDSIIVPNHLTVERSGFLTLHQSRKDGRSLLLWKLIEGSWEIATLIHLDLCPHPRPWITYDGHRILIVGQDDIGPNILVYHVLDSDSIPDSEGDPPIGEASKGGVYHMVNPHVVRFANRIRHVALGGFDESDSIHLACNERFIVVNTRKGNHLGTSTFRDGLLVIDLQDPRSDASSS